ALSRSSCETWLSTPNIMLVPIFAEVSLKRKPSGMRTRAIFGTKRPRCGTARSEHLPDLDPVHITRRGLAAGEISLAAHGIGGGYFAYEAVEIERTGFLHGGE
ncbi:MAG: hypothetical protein WAN43_08925, partial [Rhodomicrobium sp.]